MAKITSNVPAPEYGEFIGRELEIATLKYYLSHRYQNHIIVVDGTGGIGKTALANYICNFFLEEGLTLPPEDRFSQIIWVSAKIADMTPSGQILRPLEQVHSTKEAFLSEIANELGLLASSTIDEEEREEKVLQALVDNRLLVVLDSFEQLKGSAKLNILDFLDHVPTPSRTKFLLTTRPQEKIERKPVSLTGLNMHQSIELMRQLSLGHNDPVLGMAELQELYELSAGVPLVIHWAISQIYQLKEAYSIVVSKLRRGAYDLSSYCVSDSFNSIQGRKAEGICRMLFSLSRPVSRQMLGEITELSKEIKLRDSELDLLVSLQLIFRNRDDKFKLNPLPRAYLLENVSEPERIHIVETLSQYYYSKLSDLLGKHGRVDIYLDPKLDIWADVENSSSLLEPLADSNPVLFCDLLEVMRYLLYMQGDWVTRDQYMLLGIQKASAIDDFCRQILFSTDVAWVAAYGNRSRLSYEYFKSVEPLIKKCEDPYYKAKYYLDFGRFLQLETYDRNEIIQVEKAYMAASEFAAEVKDAPVVEATCLYYRGLLYYYELGNKNEAQSLFEKGYRIAIKHKAQREADRHESMLALLKARDGHFEEARNSFDKIIATADRHDDFIRTADYKFTLGMIEYEANNRAGSQILLKEASEIYQELGRIKDLEAVTMFRRKVGLETA